MENELAVYVPKGSIDPEKEIEFGTRAANALKRVVDQAKLARKFGGDKEHLFFEAWQTIGQFYSATPRIAWSRAVENLVTHEVLGFEARAELVRGSEIIGAAEASCMRDEPNWKNKPIFQLRSMSQTRAMSKVLRSCFAWVVVLAGYAATPAEEMDGIDEGNDKSGPKPESEKLSEPLTEKQLNAIWAIGKSLNLTEDGIKSMAFKILGHPVDSLKGLSKDEGIKIIGIMQKERK